MPASFELVFIFGDKDCSLVGTRSARALRDRLAQKGIIACIESIEEDIPKGSKGIDWNDILRNHGMEAFPMIKL
ncbi:toprim domain-containing protein [Parasutterella excrementihominis]|uniref:toprim domain-containing protein n=1 Tax=Parasutterella excrementihominis TaxID=487175 RepID=UPI0034608797